MDRLHGFDYFINKPINSFLADTKRAALIQGERSKSVVTSRFEDEVRRKIRAE